MALTHASGKHRRPRSRVRRRSAHAVGIAGLAAVGVVGTLATPALADTVSQPRVHDTGRQPSQSQGHDTGLTRAAGFGDSLAETVSEQARAQQAAAKKRAAVEKAERERAAKEKAARAAERARLKAYVAPVAHSFVSTPYKSSGGLWSSGSHTGIDFHADEGTPVKSVAAGKIVEAGESGAFGNNIVIKHRDGTYTQYGHLSSIGVSVGQSVSSGEKIALSGSTGNTTGPHLHFEARSGPDYGSDMDPIAYLKRHGVHV